MEYKEFVRKFTTVNAEFVNEFLEFHTLDTKQSDFVINLERVAKWLDAKKSNLKDTLVKSYILNVDYQVTKIKRSQGRGGARHEDIMLTPQAFKLLCMQSRSKKSDLVRMYYLELENLMMKYKDDIHEKIQQRLDQLENNEQQKAIGKTRYGAIYIFQTPDDDKGKKLGKAIDVAKRLKAHASGLVNDIRVLWIHETEDLDRVESCVHNLLRPYRIRTGKREIYHVTLDIMQQAVRECDCLVSRWVGKGRKPTRSDCKVFMMIDRSGARAP